jgi:enoyl-CoA hydratase/carnithine racemase
VAQIDLTRDGDVFVLQMKSGENRFNPDFLGAFAEALDEVEASSGPAALVTTGEGKFYSNGLDLAAFSEGGPEVGRVTLERLHALFGRLLGFPMLTVAAINGHAFAGGFMLAMTHDFRAMREDRGFLCLPEIDLGMEAGLSLPMEAVLEARLSRAAFHEMLVTGARYGAADALRLGMIESSHAEADVLPRAVERAQAAAAKRGPTMASLKRNLFGAALEKIRAGAETPFRA